MTVFRIKLNNFIIKDLEIFESKNINLFLKKIVSILKLGYKIEEF